MSFLPIVERELRVASRRRFTYWGRVAAAGFALVIFGLLQGLVSMARGGLVAGQIEFAILKWMSFIFACCAGVFLTSDSISEEKREGTLGLLFLTDLKGYDVVFGKLLSQSMRAFYGVLAAFPILALPLLGGGVTGSEFALSMLVIANTLFFSLAVGLFVSTVSRDYTKAMSGAFLVCLLFLLGPLFADSAISASGGGGFKPVLSLADPAWLFAVTGARVAREFWPALALQHGLAWGFLLLASFLAPRIWQERSGTSGGSASSFSRRWRFGGARFRAALRRRWLQARPVHWLAMRDRWLPRLVGVLALLVIASQGYYLVEGYMEYFYGSSASSFNVLPQLAATAQRVFGIGLTLWVAAKASHIFIDSMRSGALELLLVAPVTPRAIVQAQWTALWRTFLIPALCIVLLQTGAGILSVLETQRTFVTMASPPPPAVASTNGPVTTNFPVTNKATGVTRYSIRSSVSHDMETYQIVSVVLGAITTLTGLASVAWFGMWMGLTSRKISGAVLKTVCFVYILPWIAYGFIYGFVFAAVMMSKAFVSPGGSPFSALLVSTVIATGFSLVKDTLFIMWSHQRLLSRFREKVSGVGRVAMRGLQPLPPPLPRSPTAPPPIPPAA